MGIDNQLAKLIYKNKLMDEVDNIVSHICNFQSIHLPTAKNIRVQIRDFESPTEDIESKINEFISNLSNYQVDLSKPKSTFITDMVDFLTNHPCIQMNLTFPELDPGESIADAWNRVLSLLKMPADFVHMIDEFIFKSITDLIKIDYPFPEFSIGIDLSFLKFNSLVEKIPEFLLKLDDLILCLLETYVIDLEQIRYKANGCLSKVLLTSEGSIDYTIFSTLPSQTVENIKTIEYNTRVVLNNIQNEMAKARGVFEEFPIPPMF